MNFKIAFAFLGIITLEVLLGFLIALNCDCLFDFDYVCYNVLEIYKSFMTLLNYTLIGSYIIEYIINDISEDEVLSGIICDVIVKKLQKKSEEDSENDSIENSTENTSEDSENNSSEGSLHESDIICEDSMESESENAEENTEQNLLNNETSELKQRNIEDRINEIDIDKSIKEFTDMIQILAENRNENQTETHE